MTVRYVSTGLDWTEAMKSAFREEVLESIRRAVHVDEVEVSAHVAPGTDATYELWVIVQIFDDYPNFIRRVDGSDFLQVARHAAKLIGKDIIQKKDSIKWNLTPFSNSSLREAL